MLIDSVPLASLQAWSFISIFGVANLIVKFIKGYFGSIGLLEVLSKYVITSGRVKQAVVECIAHRSFYSLRGDFGNRFTRVLSEYVITPGD